MAAKDKIQRRLETRSSLIDQNFKGYLRLAGRDEPVDLRPVDVSRRGLGFITKTKLNPGDRIWLVINDFEIRVELAYCSSHLGIDNLFRCGLFTWDPNQDLTKIFRDMDLIDGDYSFED